MVTRGRRILVWLAALLGCYVLLAALVWSQQDRLLFVGAAAGRGVPVVPPPGVEVGWLTLADGTRIRCAIAAPAQPRAVVLFTDGNGADLRSAVEWAARFAHWGVAAVCTEHPGYGDSQGVPSVAALGAAADAASAAARTRWPELPRVAAGHSLGATSAVRLAAAAEVERALLLAPFTTLAAVAQHHYRWLPVGLLLRHRFDNLTPAAKVRVPVWIVHGLDDDVVPAKFGRALADALGPHATFLGIEGHGHNDLPLDGQLGTEIARFLRGD